MQNFDADLAHKLVCLDNYSLSCLNDCIEWVLDTKINANNQDIFYVYYLSFFLLLFNNKN
jgi:hypothetical protein